jgi:phage baseplate assembly protein W
MKSIFFGFNPPFLKDGRVMPVQTDERLIKNDLLQLLLTIPGERSFRPTFGTAIQSSLFEPSDSNTIRDIRSTMLLAIRSFEPRVEVTELLIEPAIDGTQLDIKLFGFIKNEPDIELEVELALPLGPAATPAPPAQLI